MKRNKKRQFLKDMRGKKVLRDKYASNIDN